MRDNRSHAPPPADPGVPCAFAITVAPALAIGALAVVATGCTFIPAPEGPGPLRYRDPIFPATDTTSDLTYGSAPDLFQNTVALKLDLYEPHGDSARARPAIVLVHGGAFSFGAKSSFELVDLANSLGQRGIVSVSIDYRLLAPNGCYGDDPPSAVCVAAARGAQHDAQAAVRWLRANAATYRIDPDRIAMAGSSAGGITALLAAYLSDDPGASGNPGPSSAIAGAISLSAGIFGAAALWEPVTHRRCCFTATKTPRSACLGARNHPGRTHQRAVCEPHGSPGRRSRSLRSVARPDH